MLTDQQKKELDIAQSRVNAGSPGAAVGTLGRAGYNAGDIANLNYAKSKYGYTPSVLSSDKAASDLAEKQSKLAVDEQAMKDQSSLLAKQKADKEAADLAAKQKADEIAAKNKLTAGLTGEKTEENDIVTQQQQNFDDLKAITEQYKTGYSFNCW